MKDVCAALENQFRIMRDDHRRDLLLHPSQDLSKPLHSSAVQPGRGFIIEQDLFPGTDCGSNGHSLFLAAGKRSRMTLHLFQEAETVQHLFRLLPCYGSIQHNFFYHAVREELAVHILHDKETLLCSFLIGQIDAVKSYAAAGRDHPAE